MSSGWIYVAVVGAKWEGVSLLFCVHNMYLVFYVCSISYSLASQIVLFCVCPVDIIVFRSSHLCLY